MLRQVFTQFLEEQINFYINKKAKGGKPSPKVINDANARYEPSIWLGKILDNARYGAATHVSTYSHPSAKTSCIIVDQNIVPDGLLITQNVACRNRFDVFGNATSDSYVFEAYTFLNFKDANNISFRDHLEQDSLELKLFSEAFGIDYLYFKDRLSKYLIDSNPTKTHHLVKQVYFPVSDDKYHVLSLLTSSVVQIELLQRIKEIKFSETNKIAKQCKQQNIYSEHQLNDVYGLTEVFYGGSQPQNVSILNAQKGGIAYLINSIPPKSDKSSIRLPGHNFFKTLPLHHFKSTFEHFSRLINATHNNKNIRNGLVKCIQIITDQIINHALHIFFNSPEGWTTEERYLALPQEQMIFLDQKYNNSARGDGWLKAMSKQMTFWIINTYEFLHTKDRKLTSSEIDYISNICESTLIRYKRIV